MKRGSGICGKNLLPKKLDPHSTYLVLPQSLLKRPILLLPDELIHAPFLPLVSRGHYECLVVPEQRFEALNEWFGGDGAFDPARFSQCCILVSNLVVINIRP